RRGLIGPGMTQRLEGGTGLADRVQDVEQVADAPGEPVEPRHHQHVASIEKSIGRKVPGWRPSLRIGHCSLSRDGGISPRRPRSASTCPEYCVAHDLRPRAGVEAYAFLVKGSQSLLSARRRSEGG